MNSTSSSIDTQNGCKYTLFLKFPLQFLPDDFYGLLVGAAVLELLACPFTVLFNAFVIAAVKTKRRLQTHPNILAACLALTDLSVGVVVQPLHITMTILLLQGKSFTDFCDVNLAFMISFAIFSVASLYHLVLISGERYFAIKHSFTHATAVTKARLLFASAVVWVSTTVLPLSFQNVSRKIIAAVSLVVTSLALIICLQVVVYKEVRRHEKQILSQVTSVAVKAKFQKEKKALKLTTVIITVVILCYFPSFICRVVLYFFGEKISDTFKTVVLFLAPVPVIINSLLNPVVYSVRNTQFRVAFIELLLRKTLSEAIELETRLFRRPGSTVRAEMIQKCKRQDQSADRKTPSYPGSNLDGYPEVLTFDANIDGNNINSGENENFALDTLKGSTKKTTVNKN